MAGRVRPLVNSPISPWSSFDRLGQTMTPSKRRRTEVFDDNDDAAGHSTIDVHTATSNLRRSQSKRPRISPAAEEVDDDNEEEAGHLDGNEDEAGHFDDNDDEARHFDDHEDEAGHVDDHEDEAGHSIIDVQTATSNLRHTQPNRPRLALAAENGGSVVSDEEEDLEEELSVNGGLAATAEEEAYNSEEEGLEEELPTDGGFVAQAEDEAFNSEEEEAEGEEGALSQFVRDQMGKHAENMPSECGIIEEVVCRNFMCHPKLRVKLGPLINFIIGHNGSGKSAVLTALTLCLGAKATATNRGASLKSFIKEGEESAMLSVKIKNKGEMAYQPDVYGDAIIVERHFNRAGASQFKIKNEKERLITTKRAELEDMLDYLALQLDNPMNVLSQDLARQFLSNSSPRDKYKFFLKGTQLEQLDRDYRMMEEYLDQTESRLHNREGDMAVLRQRAEEAEANKKLMDQSQTISERITHLGWMHAWAQVEEAEADVAKAETNVRNAEESIEDKRRTLEEKSRVYDNHHQNHEAAIAVKTDLEQELAPLREKHDEIKTSFDKARAELIDNQATRRNIRQDLTSAQKDVDKHTAAIAEEQARIEQANGPHQSRKVAEMEAAKVEAEEKKSELESLDKAELEAARRTAEDGVISRQRAIEPLRHSLRTAETMLQDLQNKSNQQMAAFQPSLENLLRTIRNDQRFKEKPVGPMGLHVSLKKPEWSSILERTFGGVLDSFVVTSKHDQNVLSELMRRTNYRGDVYIGNARPLDTSRNEPDPRRDTILRVLEIDNDLVRNQLIINQQADQTVLIANLEEATDFMFSDPRPANVKSCLSQNFNHRGWGIRSVSTSRGGNMSNSPVRAWDRKPRMKTDAEAQIGLQQENVNHTKRELDAAQFSLRHAENVAKTAKQALVRFDREERALRVAMQEAQDLAESLQSEIENDTIDAGTLDALHDQLREAQEQLAQHQNSYQDAVVAKENLDEAQKVVKNQLDAASKDVADAEAKVHKAELAIEKHRGKRQEALSAKNTANDYLQVAEHTKQDSEQDRVRRQATLDDWTEKAGSIHARVQVEPGMTCDIIDARLDKLTKEREAAERRAGGSREEVTRTWAQTRNEYKLAHKELRKLKDISDLLKRAIVHRKYRWKRFRQHITARAKVTFTYLLSERAFRGKIEVDHRDMAMDIRVEPDIAKTSDKGRQTRTLSGGEKSFSTICLLLSIWEAMGSPIRCLDEFDVFMDNVNRDISMKMMIGAARRSVGRQFILITPQAMGNVQLGSDVKIHKMSDPERGQTALPFGQ